MGWHGPCWASMACGRDWLNDVRQSPGPVRTSATLPASGGQESARCGISGPKPPAAPPSWPTLPSPLWLQNSAQLKDRSVPLRCPTATQACPHVTLLPPPPALRPAQNYGLLPTPCTHPWGLLGLVGPGAPCASPPSSFTPVCFGWWGRKQEVSHRMKTPVVYAHRALSLRVAFAMALCRTHAPCGLLPQRMPGLLITFHAL